MSTQDPHDKPNNHDANDQPDLGDEDAVWLRSLLADARVDESMPEPVVARLDRVLAGLADERSRNHGALIDAAAPSSAAQVVSLAAHRRRRVWAGLGAAAAAVVAFAVVLPQVTGGHQAGTAADNAATSQQLDAPGDADAKLQPTMSAPESGVAPSPHAYTDATEAPLQLTSDRVGAQLRAALPAGSTQQSTSREADCPSGFGGPAVRLTAWYDGQLAVVVVPDGGPRRALIFLCGNEQPERRVRLQR